MNAIRKVLLVEDEVLVAALAVDALEELGYQTIETTTAKGLASLRAMRSLPSPSSTLGCRMTAAMLSPLSCATRRPTCRSSLRQVTTARMWTSG